MYNEISTQFKYTRDHFETTKSRDFLEAICPECNLSFLLTKHQLQTKWRRNIEKLIYCSHNCSSLSKKASIETYCTNCNTIIYKNQSEFKKSENHFCTNSCSTSFNNQKRTVESNITRGNNIHKSLTKKYKRVYVDFKYIFNIEIIKKEYISKNKSYNLVCQICNKVFNTQNKNKNFCSKDCLKQRMKRIHLEHPHVILNRSNPESYLERSFREFIENLGYVKNDHFIQEKRWKINEKVYISDFYFPSLKLIFELDRKTTRTNNS